MTNPKGCRAGVDCIRALCSGQGCRLGLKGKSTAELLASLPARIYVSPISVSKQPLNSKSGLAYILRHNQSHLCFSLSSSNPSFEALRRYLLQQILFSHSPKYQYLLSSAYAFWAWHLHRLSKYSTLQPQIWQNSYLPVAMLSEFPSLFSAATIAQMD